MIGHFEPQDLRRAEQQDRFGARRVGRKALVEKAADNAAQCAEPPQHRGGEPPHQRAVAIGERGEARMRALAGKLFVERDAPAQHAVENVGGNAPGGEARNVRLWGNARSRHGWATLPRIVSTSRSAKQKTALAHSFAQGPRSREKPNTTQDCACANRLHLPNLGLGSQRPNPPSPRAATSCCWPPHVLPPG